MKEEKNSIIIYNEGYNGKFAFLENLLLISARIIEKCFLRASLSDWYSLP